MTPTDGALLLTLLLASLTAGYVFSRPTRARASSGAGTLPQQPTLPRKAWSTSKPTIGGFRRYRRI